MSLDKLLTLDRYSLLEADLRQFYYSLSLYIKQEIKQLLNSPNMIAQQCFARAMQIKQFSMERL